MTQEEILKMLERRDPGAIHMLIQHYGAYCCSIVMRILPDEQDVNECCNDVWLQVWQHIPPMKPLNLKLYIGKTARNLALHRLEHNNAQKRSAIVLQLDELAQVIPDHAQNIQVDKYVLQEILRDFLSGLSQESRQVFILRYWYGETVEEIAKRFHCSTGRISIMLFRTRKKLRNILEKEDFCCE